MVVQLGANPWFLILIAFLEILFIVIPPYIAARIENTKFIFEIQEMGFGEKVGSYKLLILKILIGIAIGIIFFLIGGYIALFFRNILIQLIFGTEFVNQAQEGAISTTPINPDLLQMIIIIIQQIFVIAVCEEAFFRGFLIKKFNKKYNLNYCILFSSLIFTFYHVPLFIVPISTIITFSGYYFTFGVLLGILYVRFKNSIIPCILAHGIFNILIFLL